MPRKSSDQFPQNYQKLNPAQREAVDTIEGPVMVVAGPGTGKTQVLTLRIANILARGAGAKPEEILALTFTNAGVLAMRQRLREIAGDTAYRVGIFTFHSFCEQVIREFPFYFKALLGARVINDLERVEILEKIIRDNDFSELTTFHDEFYFLSDIASAINNLKKEGLTPEQFLEIIPEWEKQLLADENIFYKKDFGKAKKGEIKPAEQEKINKKIAKARELAKIFELYQEELKKLARYDFHDMILSVLSVLETNGDLKSDLQEKYQYLLIDEHQDTNIGQNKLIELLTDAAHLDGRANVFAVGDEKQSIYRFQGASAETFRHFTKLYQDIKQITLTENYRSGQDILDGATSLIKYNAGLTETETLHANKQKNKKIEIKEFSNYKFELLYLAQDIAQKIKDGIKPSEIAVIYRAHRYVSDIKSVLEHEEIPYTIFSHGQVLADDQIQGLITLLRVVSNPNDEGSLGKALFIPFLNLDAYENVKILEKFRCSRREDNRHVFAILEKEKKYPAFVKLIKELKTESERTDFSNFFKVFLEKSGYLSEMLSASDGQARLLKIDKLFDEIKKQADTRADYQLTDFLRYVDALEKYNLDIDSGAPEIIEGVNLMTAHGAKGREFAYVYIINATRRAWEGNSARRVIDLPIPEYAGDVEDERRLFYVAMTRAAHSLAISYSRSDNDGREQEASQFVSEISEESRELSVMRDFEEQNINKLFNFITPVSVEKTLLEPEYIRELFLTGRTLNVSALNNYLSCPIRYFYKNLIQIPSSYESRLEFGSVIHESLETFFTNSREAGSILSKKVLLQIFTELLKTRIFSEKEEKKFRARGEELLSEYYDQYAGEWTAKVEVEKYVKRDFELASGETIQISGKLDKIEFLDSLFEGKVNIVDYKTGRTYSEKNKDEKKDLERQIVFYHLLLAGYDGGRYQINQSVLDFVEPNKKGQFEQHSFPVTSAHLAELEKEINQCAEEILSLKFLNNGCGEKDCEWCHLWAVTH